MAESVVSFALEKLAALLIAEAEFLGSTSLSRDVKALANELATIKEVLKDAEKRAEQDDFIKEWLRQVREIGYCVEDAIDEYFLLQGFEQQKQQQQSFHNTSQKFQFFLMITRIRKWLGKAAACVSELKPKYELASKIKEIKAELLEMSNRRERYKIFTKIDNSNQRYRIQQNPQVYSLFMDDFELFGIKDHKAKIVEWLNLEQQDHHVEKCSRSVIAVVGMGGIGKTTLVRKVYEDKEIRDCFPVYAWVTVSPSYQWIDLLKIIYKQVHVQPSLVLADASDEINIISNLRNHIKDKRYVVVFDDVWDAELWRSVKAVLPSNNNGSRILMTTRDKNIALLWMASLGGGQNYDLKPLHKEAAWDLFCHKAFGNGNCPSELEELSQDMVKKCEGLPLAIVTIAGLLSIQDKVPSEWNKVYNSLSFELGSNQHFTSVTKILLLSYHELPYYLKPCFLYFGMLPEAFFLGRMKLIQLWIAEGFIQNQRGRTLEEVAEEYLSELVNRNLVQVYAEDFTKRSRLFRVHDILREMIILPKLENLGFCQVLSQGNSSTTKHFRRLSINTNIFHGSNSCNVSEMLISNSSLRSLLWFNHPGTVDYLVLLSSLLKVSRYLKVLDLEDSPIDHIPEELVNLRHLLYLSLRRTKVKILPKSIGELRNLQTLNLKHCNVVELPREIGQCHKLRHLLTFRVIQGSKQGVKIHDGVLENFKELQKLAYAEANTAFTIQELQHVKQLRRIAITKVKTEHGRALCCVIEEMKHLRSLSVKSIDHEFLDLQYISTSQPLKVERLYLEGKLEEFPDWITKLKYLARLHLISSRLEDDPVKILQVLPNLLQLTLKDAYIGEKLDFGFTQFSKLEMLELYELHNLKSLVGVALPALRDANVVGCPLLQKLPPPIYEIVTCKIQDNIRVGMYTNPTAIRFTPAAKKGKNVETYP